MHPMLRIIVLSFLVLSAAAWAAPEPGNDPFIGTWRTNLAKSKYNPGPPPSKPGTVTIEPNGNNGIKVTVVAINAKGEKTVNQYSASYDGKEVPFTQTGPGAVSGQTVTLRRIDANTVERIGYLGGKKLVTEKWVVSKDGKTRTNTQTGMNAQGEFVNNVIVNDRLK